MAIKTGSIPSRSRRAVLTLPALGLALGLLLLSFAATAAAVPPKFPDVPAHHPYHQAVYELADQGIISGYADGTFGPGDSVLRQQFAKMIVKTLGLPVSAEDHCPFGDVPTNLDPHDPLYPDKYVAVCAAHRITVGKTPTTFDPYASITREQLITMVVRAAGLPAAPSGYTPPFTTSQFSTEEHYANVGKAHHAGLLEGLQGLGTGYNFTLAASRGECAQLLYNLLARGSGGSWAHLAAGGAHSLALKKDGSLWAWGYNSRGQLGDGTGENRNQPTRVTED